jgi:hypothetical protein
MNQTEQQTGGEPEAEKTVADAPAADTPPAEGAAPPTRGPEDSSVTGIPASTDAPAAGDAESKDTFGNEAA